MAALNASGVVIELSDGQHRLIFDMNQLIEIEAEFGGLEAVNEQLEKTVLGTCRTLIRYGLAHEKDYSLEEVGLLMTGARDLVPIILQALGESLIGDEEVPKAKAPRATKTKTANTRSES